MKKSLTILILLALFIFPKNVFSQGNPYFIENFQADININKDTSATVTETLKVNFGEVRHGIFRIIPIVYSVRGKTQSVGFDLISVSDEAGNKLKFEKNRLGQGLKIKIGDPDKTVIGNKTYVIKYKIKGVLQKFDSHNEFYWNITGHEWDTQIFSAGANLTSPFAGITKIECFAGYFGSQEKYCYGLLNSKNGVLFSSTSQLGEGRDFTIIVGLDKENQLVFPSPLESIINLGLANWGYFATPIPFSIIFFFWFKRGRDKKYSKDTIYYRPDEAKEITSSIWAREHLPLVYHPIQGLSPSEVGTIVDEKVDIADVVAEILELARLGYLKIQKFNIKKILKDRLEYAFIKTDKTDDGKALGILKNYQKVLLDEIFRSSVIRKSVSAAEKIFKADDPNLKEARELLAKRQYVLLSGLKSHFYEGLPLFKKRLYERMEEEKIFHENPEKVRAKWIAISVISDIFAFPLLMYFFTTSANLGPLVPYILLSGASIFFAASMPRRTAWGYSLKRQIEGLAFYLKKGKWRHEIAEKHLFIEEILPLAVSLKVVEQLTKDMSVLEITPPSYFEGVSITSFQADLRSFSSISASTFLSSPQGSWSGASSWSGGSGFSGGGGGGGFGGGGGGSW